MLSHLIDWLLSVYSVYTVYRLIYSEEYITLVNYTSRIYIFVFKITLFFEVFFLFSFFYINTITNLCLEDQVFLYAASKHLLSSCRVLSLMIWAGNTNWLRYSLSTEGWVSRKEMSAQTLKLQCNQVSDVGTGCHERTQERHIIPLRRVRKGFPEWLNWILRGNRNPQSQDAGEGKEP